MTSLLRMFERIYVVNLESRGDRRLEMSRQLTNVGLNLFSHPVELFPAIRPQHAGEYPSVGARGCFLSHLGILRLARESGLKSVLILEDDLNFIAQFAAYSELIASQLSSAEFAVFYGGGALKLPVEETKAPGLITVASTVSVGLTHFVGFNGHDCINDAVDYLEAIDSRTAGDPQGGPMHVDGAYGWFRRAKPQYQTVIAYPELGYQRASRTDIHQLRWFDRFTGLRSVAAAVRRIRNG